MPEKKDRLEEPEELYRNMIELFPDGIVAVDAKGIILVYNTAASKIAGYSKDEIVGKHFSKAGVFRAREIPKYLKIFSSCLIGKIPKPFEMTVYRKDRTTFLAEARVGLLKVAGKKIIQVIFRNITERKRAEEALKESEERYGNLVQNALDIIFNVSLDGTITYLNPAFEPITGWSRSEWIGKPFAPLIHPDDLPLAMKLFQDAIQQKASGTLEARIIAKSGEYLQVEAKSTPLTQKGRVAGFWSIARNLTERKQMESALRESKEKLQRIFEAVGDGIIVTNLNGIITDMNEKALQLSRFGSKSDLIGKSSFEFIASRDQEKALNRMQQAAQQGEGGVAEFTLARADGSEYLAEISVSVVKDTAGNPVGFISAIRDITERKRVEEALRESEEKYSTLVEKGNDGILIIQDDLVRFANPKLVEITGFSLEEAVGKPFIDFIAPEYRGLTADRYKKRMAGEEVPPSYELEILTKDGRKIPMEVNASKIEYEKKPADMAILRDITERKRAEERIGIFSQAITGAIDAIAITDMKGIITYANPAMEEMYEYEKGELIGKPVSVLSQKQEMVDEIMSAMIETGSWHGEIESKKKNKEIFPALLSLSTVSDIKGNPIAMMGAVRDITERKQAEAKLREIQQQLVRSEKLAAIGQLAGGVGHELRNPLGAIKNAAYYVRGKVAKSELAQKEPRVMEFLNIMDDEINASNKIINDLLGFSRVGKPTVSPTQIKNVIEDALSRTPIPESIELIKKLDAELPQVEIDASQIQQVLVNIISNAVQAMPEGGKLIIGTRGKEGRLEVRIADTGCGIPKEAIDKIFDPLFTTKAKGIGLGLAVCKTIIDRHEGEIEIKSQVGKGTTFIIRLPLNRK